MIEIKFPTVNADLACRRIDNQDADIFLKNITEQYQNHISDTTYRNHQSDWTLHIQEDAIFDKTGIITVINMIKDYKGNANYLNINLELPFETWRDYYSLQYPKLQDAETIELPMHASRSGATDIEETIIIKLQYISTPVRFPTSLTKSIINITPTALLMKYSCDHDLLFANQVIIFSQLAQSIKQSPWTWLKACFMRKPGNWKHRMGYCYKQIHESAYVHPTAIVEGSTIGPGCHIGAHCVVRFSRLGEHVKLHDGCKVEYSIVDDYCWLMHDLVLYRCHVEPESFLIHGPYQFSCFQKKSAAFATIMMDYRPDQQAIKVMTPDGVRSYGGCFMGALLEEKSKAVGGSLLAPGITIPNNTTVGPKIDQIILPKLIDQFKVINN